MQAPLAAAAEGREAWVDPTRHRKERYDILVDMWDRPKPSEVVRYFAGV